MRTADATPFYRHAGIALLRSAVSASTHAPDQWPDPSDTQACCRWLSRTWSRPEFADAIRQASPTLADRVDAIRTGHTIEAKQVRRITLAVARYVLRATGRPTPFGLFAGVAPVTVGRMAQVRWGAAHRPVVRADTQWLADIIDGLEACQELLDRLDVTFTNLATRRGGWLEAPRGANRVRIRHTSAISAVLDTTTASPVRFSKLTDKLVETFGGADRSAVCDMLTELVRQGFLITCLRAPFTTTDPLDHLLDRLDEMGVDALPSVARLLCDLEAVRTKLRCHNQGRADTGQSARESITRQMQEVSPAGRTPLAVDLLLDCDVFLPDDVAQEVEWAASALLRLTRHPAGQPAWRAYHASFCERYGTGTLVPVTEVVNPDAGLGYPAGYPGSIFPAAAEVPSMRDDRLLALAWQTVNDGGDGEINLTEEAICALVDDERLHVDRLPPHVELAVRVYAASVQALKRGEYTLTVAPARAGGTLTSRFTPTTTGSGLENVYRALPVATETALPVQMSFPPAYPHAENICRVPALLPHVLSLGEHRGAGEDETIVPVSDLAITATADRLHLVSLSRRRVVEPQVFHALALDKQPPPLARFLAHLPRAFAAGWTVFDWGPHADRLPYLPRVRYRRSVLTPARWRLTAEELSGGEVGQSEWRQALDQWRDRWSCPSTVDLRDDDRTLRLTLDEPLHAAILQAHLARYGHAVLTEAATEFGWFDDHAHEFAVPLVTTRPAAPSPLTRVLPAVTNGDHGHLPGCSDASWLYAKIHTHPERHDEIIAEQLPELLAILDSEAVYWFVRYRSPHETDHLRLRLRIPGPERHGEYASVVGSWARRLRHDGVIGRLTFDTYLPEVGRYGSGAAMEAAEAVFVADSHAVTTALRHLPATVVHPTALAAISMVNIVSGFLGTDQAMTWLVIRPAPTTAAAVDRTVVDQAVRLVQGGALRDLSPWPARVAEAWRIRAAALAFYRDQLPAHADTDTIVESLLHMHHNRAIGIDPDGEHTCRRIARQVALAWRAQQAGPGR